MIFNASAGARAAALKAIWLIFAVALHLAVVMVADPTQDHDRIVAMVSAPDREGWKECQDE